MLDKSALAVTYSREYVIGGKSNQSASNVGIWVCSAPQLRIVSVHK